MSALTNLPLEWRADYIAAELAQHVGRLVAELLPGGHFEGRHEWVCPAAASPFGCSVSVHLTGEKAGVWSAWAAGGTGDLLDLAAKCRDESIAESISWARRWLGIDQGKVETKRRVLPISRQQQPELDPDRWRKPWLAARPIIGTIAATYLARRGLTFDDPKGRTLRFTANRIRRNLADDALEHHPALLCALRDIRTGDQCGIINIFESPNQRYIGRWRRGQRSCADCRESGDRCAGTDRPSP